MFTRFDFIDRTALTFEEKTHLFKFEREEQRGDNIGRLMQVIRKCIAQKSWGKQGGSATIEWSEQLGVFRVKGPHDLQKRIEEFQVALPKAEQFTSQWLMYQGLPDVVTLRKLERQIVKVASIGPTPLESDEKVVRESAQWQAELDGIETVNKRIREEAERELRAIREFQSSLKRN